MSGKLEKGPDAAATAPGAQIVELTAATSPISANGQGGASRPGELLRFPKTRGVTFVAALSAYNGASYLDLREWAERDGEPVATKKGVTVPLSRVAELGEALTRAGAGFASGEAPRDS